MNNLLLFDKAPVILFIVDKEGNILNGNQLAKDFLGKDSDNISSLNFCDLLDAESNNIKSILNQPSQIILPKTTEVKLKGINNKSFYTSLSINNYFDEESKIDLFIISVFDLTHQKMQAELIKESQLRFENIANSAPVMIWITDVSGLFTFVNNIWGDFTSRTTGE
ncbi:MAG: PAS domain-containing protein, partial [Ignavibacteriaceae bacterium]